ncbi:hypothetical protein LWI28_027633 [Acer negundo]|uniref:Uncharacterized protein n=1 Tax=Acer negundo TaxID=4023 RepID=A0AAD5JBQ2_ACENE|nr:hypothetical protein LWI28_027633 [Acer negundo]
MNSAEKKIDRDYRLQSAQITCIHLNWFNGTCISHPINSTLLAKLLVTVHMTPTPAEKQQTYYKSIDMDFVCSSFIHRGCTAQAYQTESITDYQVGCELPIVILDLDNQETKKKKEQIDSHPKSCPPSIQRTLFLNNESLETSAKPNGMDDPSPKEVTYKSMCGMMAKVLFDVLPKVLPHTVVKDVLPNEVTEKKYFCGDNKGVV